MNVASILHTIGLPETLSAQLHFADTTTWPPQPGSCISPDFPDMPRIWARISLAEWLNTAPRAFGLHRSPELTALAAADRWLRRAGEGTHILWALDMKHPGFDAHLLSREGCPHHAEEVRRRVQGPGGAVGQ